MKWLYLALDLTALAGPVALSFDRRVAFYRNYRHAFPAILGMMLVFVPWDMAFVAGGIWGFDARYVTGVAVGNLPVEEWLFFPVVSYACLFIYECLRCYVKNDPLERWHRPILLGLAAIGLVLALTHPTRLYTSLKVGTASFVGIAATYLWHPSCLARFTLTYLISWVPFLLMNGILTGAFIEGQVVWYSPAHILGFRIGTIPVEDSYYNLLMQLTTTVIYEALRRRAA